MTTARATTASLASAAAAALIAPQVAGGEAKAQVPPAAAARAPTGGGDIIITARRRDEPLGRAGAPVSVIGGDAIVETGTSQVERLNERFPALTVQPTATGNLIFIRGVGNFTLHPNSDPAVAFAYDGVFVSRPLGTVSQFFDLDRIELLKGPQGVLYGRNASAGSINLEPRQPVIGEISARAHLTAATYSNELVEGAVNLPIGRAAALRLSGAISEQDHFLTGYQGGPEQHSARAQLKAALGDKVTVRLAGDYNHIGGIGVGTSYLGNYVFVPAESRYRFVEAGLPLSLGIYAPDAQSYRETIFLPLAGRRLDSIGSRPRQSNHFFGVHARVDAKLGFADLTILPAWRRSTIDSIVSGSPFGYGQLEEDEQTSLEARLTGRNGSLEWLAGAFLFDETIDSDVATNLSSSHLLTSQDFGTRSSAGFGNVTIHASPTLRLSGGLRWTRDYRTFASDSQSATIICLARDLQNRPSCPAVPLFPLISDFADAPFPVPELPGGRRPIVIGGVATGAVVARGGRLFESRLTDQALTWRVGGEADLAPRTLLYATAEAGHRPGGFNAATGFEFYDAERITAFTLGLRHRAFRELLELDLEAFWWDYRDQQVSSLRPDLSSPPVNANITENIGNSRIAGAEAEIRLRPWSGTRLGAIVQYLDAQYRSFEYLQANTGVPPLTGCATALDTSINLYTVDCRRQRPYNSPKLSLSLNGRHRVALGDFALTAVADTHFRSARNIGFHFLPEQRVGPTWTSNAQLILGLPGDGAEIAAFVRNIEGDRIRQFSIFHPASNALIAVTSPPRQWGLRSSLRF